MIYKPQTGRMKDNCIYYANGKYYHYSMYCKKDRYPHYNNVFLSISEDGVHFQDYGCVVEDFPKRVWAMKVYQGKDAYYMNSGSFTDDERQAILKFWRSEDLVHWEYQPELDLLAPSDGDVRLDCMNIVKMPDKYYGFSTGDYLFWESDDGKHWTIVNGTIETGPMPQDEKHFEIADCIEIDGEFYLFSGAFGHLGSRGYGVYLYKSDDPFGPFRPIFPHYRINGTSKRWVNMWERCFKKGTEILANNYMYDGYTYECGETYLPPLKKIEKYSGSLRLRWWEGNNVLYGDTLTRVERMTACTNLVEIFEEYPTTFQISKETLALPEKAMIECTFEYQNRAFTQFPRGGVLLSEGDGYGTALLFDGTGRFEIVRMHDGKIEEVEDRIDFGSCAPFWLQGGEKYNLRILLKQGLFEIYVNDVYLQTFNNAHFPDTRAKAFTKMSAISVSGKVEITDITLFEMKMD